MEGSVQVPESIHKLTAPGFTRQKGLCRVIKNAGSMFVIVLV